MRKNKWGKCIALAAVLLMVFACTVAASAEENGYWIETVDSEGRQIQIFTYTKPVEITFEENGYGCLPEEETAAEPVAVEETVAKHMADGHLKTAQAIPAGSSHLGGVAALGAVMLLVLGVALYKAV